MSSLKLLTIMLGAAVLSACGGGKVVPNTPEPSPSSKSSLSSSSVSSSIVSSSSLIDDIRSSSSSSKPTISSSSSSKIISSSSIAPVPSSSSSSSRDPVPVSSSSKPLVVSSSSSSSSSALPGSIYHVRGTFNTWLEGTLMTRVGSSDIYELCANFAAGDAANGGPRFKVDPNGGWVDSVPATDYLVAAGWVKIFFNAATTTVSAQQNLTANCANATSASSVASVSSSSQSTEPNTDSEVKSAMGTLDSRLACYKGAGEKACNLRTYQVMVESFVNGDDTINMNVGYGSSHHKGDLQGVINSLDYIKSLGVNTLWLTPVFDSTNGGSPSQLDATGYFASNYFNIDKYFGTKDKLKELVDKAHEKGLYVLLDGVFGHSKSNANNFPSPSGKSLIKGPNNSVDPLPYPDNLEFFKEVATWWISNYKIDGWRLDQAYQVPVQYWGEIRSAVEATSKATQYTDASGNSVNPLGFMVGEIWKDEATIAAKGYGTAGSAGLLSNFDFPMRYRLVQTLAQQEEGSYVKNPASHLNGGFDSQKAYPDHAMPNLMLTNHDLVRFGDLIQRAGLAGPNDDQYWGRHRAALSFLAAYSGPITLYYGDEIGQEVANFAAKNTNNCSSVGQCEDHVSRDSGVVDGVVGTLSQRQKDLKAYVASLMKLREDHPALWNGSRTYIYGNASVYIDRKDKGSDHVLYVLNTTNAEARISVAASAIGASGDLVDLLDATVFTNQNGTYQLVLPPFKAAFLKLTPQ